LVEVFRANIFSSKQAFSRNNLAILDGQMHLFVD
jgi:hypothetical protein